MLYTLQDVHLMIYGGKDMTNDLIALVLVPLRECRAPFLYKTQCAVEYLSPVLNLSPE